MKQRIVIKNFGPIANIDIEISDFMLLIGQQASGKSTTAKSIFFFKSLRDDLLRFVLSELNSKKKPFFKAIGTFAKKVRQKYLDYWGPTFHLDNILLKYYYTEDIWIEITLEENKKFISPSFSPAFRVKLLNLIESITEENDRFSNARISFLTNKDIIQIENERSLFFHKIESAINEIFNEDRDLLFIPAGRSLLSTLSEQLQTLDTRKLDFLMRTFVERIVNVKQIFNVGIDDLILEKKKLTQDYINKEGVLAAKELITKILKGKYKNDKDGEKLFIDAKKFTKLSFSSSGQQESIWILHLIFLLILENQKAFIVIEEPEAHLFPVAQNDMAELIVLLNNMNNSVIITTHSPYLLSNFNTLLYANEIGHKHPDEVMKLLPKLFWLDSRKCEMYFIENGELVDILEQDINTLKVEMIDQASTINNKLYNSLFDLD